MAEHIAALSRFFDRLSRIYDFIIAFGSVGMVYALQKRASQIIARGVPPNAYIADIGAGTGTFAQSLARFCPGATVLAVDISFDMLRRARARACKANLPNVLPILADAHRLPFKESTLDGITSSLVIKFLPRWTEFLNRLYVFLKPGAPVAIIEIVNCIPAKILRFVLKYALWPIGAIIYTPGGWKHFMRSLYRIPPLQALTSELKNFQVIETGRHVIFGLVIARRMR